MHVFVVSETPRPFVIFRDGEGTEVARVYQNDDDGDLVAETREDKTVVYPRSPS